MSETTFKNAQKAHRRTHKERGQLSQRASLGILEKKKDYKLRAADYHKKELRLKRMRERALLRNPDEFFHGMIGKKTKNGKHVLEGTENYSADLLKLFNTQDKRYIGMKMKTEKEKVERLQASLAFLPTADAVDSDDDDDDNESATRGKHTVFVKSKKAAKKFDPAEYFDTDKALLGRTFNRPRKEQLKDADFQNAANVKLSKGADAGFREILSRRERLDKLDKVFQGLATQGHLQGKGQRRKVSDGGPDKPATYKWKKERKR
eukprot:Clim_evm125s147 gene=Clim_evmTU125s147